MYRSSTQHSTAQHSQDPVLRDEITFVFQLDKMSCSRWLQPHSVPDLSQMSHPQGYADFQAGKQNYNCIEPSTHKAHIYHPGPNASFSRGSSSVWHATEGEGTGSRVADRAGEGYQSGSQRRPGSNLSHASQKGWPQLI